MKKIIKKNKLFQQIESKITENNNNFNISEVFDRDILNIDIQEKKIQEKKVYYIKSWILQHLDITDITQSERSNNKIWLWYNKNFFYPTFILSKKIFQLIIDDLSYKYINEKFIVWLSIDDWEYKNITISFHHVRKHEPSVLISDIDKYETNWLLVAYLW